MTEKVLAEPLDDEAALFKTSSVMRPKADVSFMYSDIVINKEPPPCTDWSIEIRKLSLREALTFRALLLGTLTGVFCSFLALYFCLKTGVIPSLNILSSLGAFLIMRFLERCRIVRGSPFTAQENTVAQTVAVSAYAVCSTGPGFGSGYLGMGHNAYEDMGGDAFPGNRETDTLDLTWLRGFIWSMGLVYFGMFLAFPLRDYVLLKQKLPFPSATVTAYVIKKLYSKKAASSETFALLAKYFAIAFVSGVMLWVFDGVGTLPIFGVFAMTMFRWAFELDVGSIGIGAILPLQINVSMVLGSLIIYGFLQPYIYTYQNGSDKWVDLEHLPGNSEYLGLQCYSIFSGLAMLLATGLCTVIMLFYSIAEYYGMLQMCRFRRKSSAASSPFVSNPSQDSEQNAGVSKTPTTDIVTAKTSGGTTREEREALLLEIFQQTKIPVWAPLLGYVVASAATIFLLHIQFKVVWYQTVVAILICPIFAFSNIQGCGRTDWDVASVYGKLLMFPFGAWNHGTSILPAIALCHVTISGCSSAASLLSDFKTGYIVGASPGAMFFAQLFGTAAGCVIAPTLFAMLTSTFTIPNSDSTAFIQGRYGTIYRTLAVVATGTGFSGFPKYVLWIALGFFLIAIVCIVLETKLPDPYRSYVPNPSGMSIGMLVGPFISLEFCLGGLLAWWWTRCNPKAAAKLPYVASGCVAGGGISVVLRCLLSLADIQSPFSVTYMNVDLKMFNVGQWVMVVVSSLLVLSAVLCGGWFWHTADISSKEAPDPHCKATSFQDDTCSETL